MDSTDVASKLPDSAALLQEIEKSTEMETVLGFLCSKMGTPFFLSIIREELKKFGWSLEVKGRPEESYKMIDYRMPSVVAAMVKLARAYFNLINVLDRSDLKLKINV